MGGFKFLSNFLRWSLNRKLASWRLVLLFTFADAVSKRLVSESMLNQMPVMTSSVFFLFMNSPYV